MFEELKKKSESTRRKIALSTSIIVTLFIFTGWVFSKGYLGYSTTTVAKTTPEPTLETPSNTTNLAESPLENSKSIFGQIGLQFNALKESIASVLVPFITGIDVYNKGDSN